MASRRGQGVPTMPTSVQRKQAGIPVWLAVVSIVVVAVLGALVTYMVMKSDPKDVDREMKVENSVPATVATNVPSSDAGSQSSSSRSGDLYPGDPSAPWQLQSFDWVTKRKLDRSDLAGLSSKQMRLLRNSIYAIHGYVFRSDDLADYFGQFNWYVPITSDITPNDFNSYERYNVQFIKKFE